MITIKLFAILKERAGRDRDRARPAVRHRRRSAPRYRASVPQLADLLVPGRIMVSVNQEFVKQDAPCKDGDEVALMPPFSGGSGLSGHVRIQQEPFSLDGEMERLKRSSASIGGIVTFLGTTRDISRGKAVSQAGVRTLPGHGGEKACGDQGAGDQGIRRDRRNDHSPGRHDAGGREHRADRGRLGAPRRGVQGLPVLHR